MLNGSRIVDFFWLNGSSIYVRIFPKSVRTVEKDFEGLLGEKARSRHFCPIGHRVGPSALLLVLTNAVVVS